MSTRKVGSLGDSVTGVDELEQSLCLLVTVRRGTIPHRPDLGSELFELLDQPQAVVQAKAPLMVTTAAAADGRIAIDAVELVSVEPGQLELDVTWHAVGSSKTRTTRVSAT